MKTKGFTLIELLVVVAIIGILATIVLASLGGAKTNAADSAIKTSLSQMLVQAETQYAYTRSYNTVCDPDSESGKLFREAFYKSGDSGTVNNACRDTNGGYYNPSSAPEPAQTNGIVFTTPAWLATVKLNGPGWFCVDSSGSAITTTTRHSFATNDPTC